MVPRRRHRPHGPQRYTRGMPDAGERFNFARDVFDRHDPARPAMVWLDDAGALLRLSYGHFGAASRRAALALAARGLRPGATVMLLLPRLPAWWEAQLGCLRGGFVASAGTVQLTARDLARRLPACEAAAVVADADAAAALDEAERSSGHRVGCKLLVGGTREGWERWDDALRSVPDADVAAFTSADTHADDRALLFFTSGTTGYPKMALHTQQSYGRGHEVTARWWLGLREDDLHWNLSDTGWAKAAWSSFFAPWIAGCTLFVHHAPRFAARRTLELLAAHPITTLCGAPTNWRLLIREDLATLRFPALRSCTAAGEPMNPEVIDQWRRATGLTLRDGYGQTETVLAIGNPPGRAVKPGSMGVPSPAFEVAVLDDALRPQPPGVEGEVAIRCEPRPTALFAGYWKDEARTAACMRDGWYLTGDRASVDADGDFWFVGRGDDVIKSSAYRIGPFEVESALLEHPAVVESAVVGVPDELRGQIVKAFIVLAPDAAARVAGGTDARDALIAELQRFVQERTAPYKYPRVIEFVRELPKTVSGKIRRVELRGQG
jgi:acyl-coenzyme A synthetase/AMP-(fatty) acid ligase